MADMLRILFDLRQARPRAQALGLPAMSKLL
jgi:hypothetical protein